MFVADIPYKYVVLYRYRHPVKFIPGTCPVVFHLWDSIHIRDRHREAPVKSAGLRTRRGCGYKYESLFFWLFGDTPAYRPSPAGNRHPPALSNLRYSPALKFRLTGNFGGPCKDRADIPDKHFVLYAV